MSRWLALLVAGCTGPTGSTEPTDGTTPEPDEPPRVLSVSPEPGAVGVPIDAPVVITFSEPVDEGAIDLGGLPFVATPDPTGAVWTVTPSAPYGSLVDVPLTLEGFVDDAGQPLAEPFTTSFQTELLDFAWPRPRSVTPGREWAFVDVAPQAGITTTHRWTSLGGLRSSVSAGAGTGDYDDDGLVDIYIGRADTGATALYRNLGDGTFDETTDTAGVRVEDTSVASPIFVDHDGDGDVDLVAPAFDYGRTRLFENLGGGAFAEVPGAGGLPESVVSTISMAWGDFDRDLDLDVFSARFGVPDPANPLFLHRNLGDGTLVDATLEAELYYLDIRQSFTGNFADLDSDGWPEILVASDHGYSRYLRNNADGTYCVGSISPKYPEPELRPPNWCQGPLADLNDENGMGATVGDYDNDGDLDWFVTAIFDPNGVTENIWGVYGNRLYQNDGTGFVVDVSEAAGVRDGAWGWGACFADLDLDGHLDLFHVNGWLDNMDISREEYGKDHSRLFLNQGDGTFTEISHSLWLDDTSMGRGLACLDHDRDGDVDLLVSNMNQPPRLLRNDSEGHGHFLVVKLLGRSPNTEGVGARVYVTVGGVTQMRELRLGSNYGSNDPVEAHFGLGEHEVVDELVVRWPDGTESRGLDVAADRFVQVSQLGARAPIVPAPLPAPGPPPDPVPGPVDPVDPVGPWASVAASQRDTCALDTDGAVTCWGEDWYGVVSDVPTATGHRDLVAGWDYACVIGGDDQVTCWGDDIQNLVSRAPTGPIATLSAGTWHACAVRANAEGVCWGSDNHGKIEVPPVPNGWAELAAGHQHTCGIRRADRGLTCWGEEGPWVSGPNADDNGPWAQVAAGRSQTCALRGVEGTLTCWGGAAAPPGAGFTSLSVGPDGHACAVDAAGEVVCWGTETWGELTPPALTGGAWASVSAGGDHTCAVADGGGLGCWGADGAGQATVPVR